MPAEDRMAGSTVGYYGPWGTSYAKNLRQVADRQSEDHWVEVMRTGDGGEVGDRAVMRHSRRMLANGPCNRRRS